MQGSIKGSGVPIDKSEFNNLNALNRIGQKDVIVDLIKQSMKDLTEEQEKFGYQTVWKTALEN